MSVRRPRFQEEESAESINISPLIDVIFILLIFFIVTMVFADGSALKIDVPQASNAIGVEEKSITVAIGSDSRIEIGGRPCEMSQLASELRRRMRPDTSVILRSDAAVPVRTLVAVMDCAKSCGATDIYLSADKK